MTPEGVYLIFIKFYRIFDSGLPLNCCSFEFLYFLTIGYFRRISPPWIVLWNLMIHTGNNVTSCLYLTFRTCFCKKIYFCKWWIVATDSDFGVFKIIALV